MVIDMSTKRFAIILEDRVVDLKELEKAPEVHSDLTVVTLKKNQDPKIGDFYSGSKFIAKESKIQSNSESLARFHRDELLKMSDWMMNVDSPLTDEQKTLALSYRKELRDISSQAGFPDSVVWPEYPL